MLFICSYTAKLSSTGLDDCELMTDEFIAECAILVYNYFSVIFKIISAYVAISLFSRLGDHLL